MTYTIVLTKRVQNKLVDALEWHSGRQSGHEKKLLKSFDNGLSYIEKNPLKCQVRYDDIRIYFLNNYKFGIHYSLEKNTIFILGFFHQSQTDESWTLA